MASAGAGPDAAASGPFVLPIDIRFADLDALGHVNSTKAFVYAEHARVEWLLRSGFAKDPAHLPIIVASSSADYHAPIQHGTRLEVRMHTSRIGTKSWESTYLIGAPGGSALTTVRTTQVAYDYATGASVPIPDALRKALANLTAS